MGSKARPAFMYEEDEEGNPIRGTKKSARDRQRPSVSQKPRSEEKRRSRNDTVTRYETGMSTASGDYPGEIQYERRKSMTSTKSPSKSHGRPSSAHGTRSYPKVTIPSRENPAHFGITGTTPRSTPPVVSQFPQFQQMPQPIPLRPRAVTSHTYPTRPVSYHAANTTGGYGTGPPLSSSAYFQQQLPPPSYPPPSPSYMRYAATPHQEYFPPQQEALPFAPRSLAQRLGISDPITRTTSAFGDRDAPSHYAIQDSYDDGYTSATESPKKKASIRVPSGRRNSIVRKAEIDSDREAMPPPPRPGRPGILRNRTTEYYTDSSTSASAVPDPPRYRETSLPRRPKAHRNSVSYDLGPQDVRLETANTSHRRQSYYGQSASTAVGSTSTGSWEDKAREATNYQEDVGIAVPLTAEALRRRQAGSSRSTKSSGSRDESDYRKSATTRTTRSGSGDDNDFTIKVKGGQARVMVGGAQIDCIEGGEIEIKRPQKSLRNGSEPSNSEYGGQSRIEDRRSRIEDRRSRVERPLTQTRRNSISGNSYTRTSPQYAMGQYI